jgi:hypothetical protein
MYSLLYIVINLWNQFGNQLGQWSSCATWFSEHGYAPSCSRRVSGIFAFSLKNEVSITSTISYRAGSW